MKERRKSLIANPGFQVRWIVQIVLGSFILINMALIAVFLVAGGELGSPMHRLVTGIAVAVVELAGLFAVFWLARRHSNRIAGPFFRVRQVANALASGDLTVRANIRTDDFFQEAVKSLDSAIQELRERIRGLQADAEKLQSGDESARERLRASLDWFITERAQDEQSAGERRDTHDTQ